MTIAEPRVADPGAAPASLEPDMTALFGELADDARIMLDRDLAMARAELRRSIGRARTAGVGFGAAALVGYLALGLLSVAAALALGELIAPALAFLVVGVALAAVAGVALVIARKNLGALDPVPHQTLDTIKEDLAWLRARMT